MALDYSYWWACLGPPEQTGCLMCAGASAGMTQLIRRSTLAAAVINLSNWPNPNREYTYFEQVFALEKVTIDEINYVVCNQAWMYNVYAGILLGEVPVSNEDCTFLNYPVYP